MNAIRSTPPPPPARRVFAEPNLQCAAVSADGATDVLMLQYRAPGRPVDDACPLAFNDLYAAVHANGDQAAPGDVGQRTLPAGTSVHGVTTMNDFIFGPQAPAADVHFEIVGGDLWYVAGQQK